MKMSGRQKTALSHSGFGLIIQTLNMRNADFSFQVFKHVNHGWVRLRAGVNHLGIAEKGVVAASNHLCCYRNRLIAYAYKAKPSMPLANAALSSLESSWNSPQPPNIVFAILIFLMVCSD